MGELPVAGDLIRRFAAPGHKGEPEGTERSGFPDSGLTAFETSSGRLTYLGQPRAGMQPLPTAEPNRPVTTLSGRSQDFIDKESRVRLDSIIAKSVAIYGRSGRLAPVPGNCVCCRYNPSTCTAWRVAPPS